MKSESKRSRGGWLPVERVRDEHPPAGAWRADALAGSPHSRLLDEIREPLEDRDPERAAALCAEVTRNALRDFAPALALLPANERRRVQALAAWALTLFDFAAQTSLEGERLSQMNRWEFELEAALGGEPTGQPVFVRMAAEEGARPWNRPALDRVTAAARRQVAVGGSDTKAAAEIGGAIAAALLGEPLQSAELLAATLLELRQLTTSEEERRRGRTTPGRGGALGPGMPLESRPAISPDFPLSSGADLLKAGGSAAERAAALAALLADSGCFKGIPAPYTRAARYLRRAGLTLATQASRGVSSPGLSAGARLVLLLKARWLRR